MPRPTPAQFAYGSVTVICSTLAMLLLSKSPSGAGVAVIAVAALSLGVLVALTAPGTAKSRRPQGAASTEQAPARASTVSAGSRVHARRDTAAPAVAAGRAGRRLAEPSLRH
ncbi:hypothetical protein GCM10012287_48220 [Streptomyces daqingensis]|uniref:Secreted protein n=1 Tax=Streptomyces daqingensis TaxID=1472640 RepID=A0ABQ2MPZ9_9ACTN|nr:hypothetical protein [Streptomyces daqingensis]GGO55895.1 hypothetical protein GCM10012287_48220 [Streptomyces daqingensis]